MYFGFVFFKVPSRESVNLLPLNDGGKILVKIIKENVSRDIEKLAERLYFTLVNGRLYGCAGGIGLLHRSLLHR